MEVELLSSASSSYPKQEKTYTEIMEQMFPMYLDAGMTPQDYWDGDVTWAKAYREVLERRREWQNQMLWVQGLYFYNALISVMPALSIKSKATHIDPYLDRPIPLSAKEKRKQEEEREVELYEKNMAKMRAKMESINAHFKQKREGVTSQNG